MDSEKDSSSVGNSKENLVGNYAVKISPYIHEKIENHVLIQKKLIDRTANKQRWIINAVEEKLANDANQQQVPKAPTLNIKLDEDLDKKILERIEFIKQFRESYSKKQWLIDAILEKLDRDDTKIGKLNQQQPQGDMHDRFGILQAMITDLKSQMLKDK